MFKRRIFKADAGQRLPMGDSVRRDEAGRVWCQLFPLGTWHRADFPGGKLDFTQELCAAFVANWQSEGAPPLPVDRHHVEDGPAAGWIEALDASGGFGPGLWGAIKWTDKAAEQIQADEYRFLSPTWAMSYASRTSGEKLGPWLYGAALLNDPYFHSMPRVAASDSTHHTSALKGKEHQMDKKRICAALGLPEDTDDNAVMEALEAKCKAAEVEVEVKPDAKDEEMKAAVAEGEKLKAALTASTDVAAKLTARVTELEAQVKAAADAAFERDVAAVLAAPKAGLPAMAETLKATAKAMGLDVVKKLVAALPDVPTSEVGVSGKPSTTGSDLEQYEALVAEQMKSGLKASDAYRAVNLSHRELAERINSTSHNHQAE